jgi:hypothetical protein
MRFLLFAVFCFGCGGTIATGDDASTGDAGPKKDATSDAQVPDAGFTSSLAFENGNGGGMFLGAFFANAQQAQSCTSTTTIGGCAAYTCPDVGPQMLPSAGTLTLSVGAVTSTATPDQTGGYVANVSTFGAGTVLGVSASGGDVPAFATQTVTSPSVLLVSPAPPSTIVTTQDLTLSWSAGEPGATVVIAIARQGFNASESVTCMLDATAGTATVPKAALATLSSGSPNGQMMIGQQRKTTFASGTFVVELVALQYQSQPITFQ